jgi:hypothetical protein
VSGANYAYCGGCDKKALYVGEEDLPENVSVMHDDCLDAMHKAARAEALAERDVARAELARVTAERDTAADEIRALETDRDEAVAVIILAQDCLSIDNPAWLILDDYDGSGDSIREVEQRMDDGSLHRASWRWADHAASRMRRAARQARDAAGTSTGEGGQP